MLKVGTYFLLSLALFSATTLLATGPCRNLMNKDECAKYPTGECFWDTQDQRCENRNNTEDPCSQIADINSCNLSKMGCFWDKEDQRCESY
ncbi:MAG: hypothetical protein WCK49_07790 [Myxococcaceae bacterium]